MRIETQNGEQVFVVEEDAGVPVFDDAGNMTMKPLRIPPELLRTPPPKKKRRRK